MDKLYPMDVDRAFKSLDKIRPSVTTWWKEGAEGQQLFADKVVTIGDVFNGRIGNLQKKGMPLDIEWNQGKLQLDYWVIPKGAPNQQNAQKFIEFATRAKRRARSAS
jgi:Spermidine/putrescine-binding periplasmic protein